MKELIHICPVCGSEFMISKPLNKYLCINDHLFHSDDRREWLRKPIHRTEEMDNGKML